MGLRDRVARLARALVGDGGPPQQGPGVGGAAGKRVLVARLPTRLYPDGPAERSVAADGLYGLARITVHEAELWGAPSPSPPLAAAATAATAEPPAVDASEASAPTSLATLDRRARFYAVVSVGRQTFASKRVKGTAGARVAAAAGVNPAAAAAPGALRFEWHEGTDVVLQRSGASLAQVAIYKGGRVEGALGDALQCWCSINLATYFEGRAAEAQAAPAPAAPAASAAAGADQGDGGQAPPALAPPPALLLTAEQSVSSAGSIAGSSAAELGSAEAGSAGADAASAAAGPAAVAAPAAVPPGDASVGVGPADASSHQSGGGSSGGGGGGSSHGGHVLQDCWLPLADPGDAGRVCGRVRVSVRAASPAGLEQQLWRRLLVLADLNGEGSLTGDEFEALLEAMGADLRPAEAAQLFAQADANGDGTVDAEELAAVLTACHAEGELHRLMKRCPVDGAQLLPGQDLANMIYVTLALDDGTGESLRGGYTTPQQVSRSWLLSLTEWATQPLAGAPTALWYGNSYQAGGLRKGAAAAHILVFDRNTKRVVEEAVSPALTLAMRAVYQSPAGRLLLGREGAYKKLRQMTARAGAYADSEESTADIPKFLEAFKGQVDMQEALEPSVSAYKTFNSFFYRKLKPEVRPIAEPRDPCVVASAADCRLTVFDSVGDATRCWIKGKQFSLAGLLGDAGQAAVFEGGSLAVFRLAPQDYHRFHAPVGGTVGGISAIPGKLMTVNPIAVNSPFADVFTRNQRAVAMLQSPQFGRVAYVAIGATVVGSILWTVEEGQEVAKGAEVGYFAFGGSTIVLLFQKGAVDWDGDLVQNSLSSLETRVLMGERLGRKGRGAAGRVEGPAGAASPAAAGDEAATQ